MQSSIWYNGTANRAVDGVTNGHFEKGSCTHTDPYSDMWWYVDLGSSEIISKVVLYNRNDCCEERLAGTAVKVGNDNVSPFTGNSQCGSSVDENTARNVNPVIIYCEPPLTGRYVTVYKLGNGALTLCEVQVFGTETCDDAPCQNSGFCHNITDDTLYKCECASAWIGKTCEQFDGCSSNPCLNYGTCSSRNGKLTCQCKNGYSGKFCEEFDNLIAYFIDVTQSSTFEGPAINAIDGGTNGHFYVGSCTLTGGGDFWPWWYLDLISSKKIVQVVIYNRIDCCGLRLTGVVVAVGNDNVSPFTGNSKCGASVNETTALTTNPVNFYCVPTLAGRYVTIYKQGSEYLTLCEVQIVLDIIACNDAPCLNSGYCRNTTKDPFYECTCVPPWTGPNCEQYDDSIGNIKKATQSSGVVLASSSRAIDGRTNGDFTQGSCTHTGAGYGVPWWYVKLISPANISTVVIYNRQDCCEERLTGVIVAVGDDNAAPFSGNSQCGSRVDETTARYINPINIYCDPVLTGRYVTIYKPVGSYVGKPVLTLCEVQIIGNLIEACNEAPCLNSGSCRNKTEEPFYECTCVSPWTGLNCQHFDECSNNPCMNNGTCFNENMKQIVGLDRNGNITCGCKDGYSGTFCQVFDEACDEAPCQNSGLCRNTTEEPFYECTCASPWTGPNCQHYDECSSNPCINNGTCFNENLRQTIGLDWIVDITCECKDGYSGTHCEVFNEACDEAPCQNSGSCRNTTEDPFYECTCVSPWIGPNCQHYDLCSSNPCMNNGTCFNENLKQTVDLDRNGGITCECTDGYSGIYCQVFDDACDKDPCQNSELCFKTTEDPFYECICASPWIGPSCQQYDYTGSDEETYSTVSTRVATVESNYGIKEQLLNLSSIAVTDKNVANVATTLASLTNNTNELDKESILAASDALKNIVGLNMANESITSDIVTVVNNVMEEFSERYRSLRDVGSSIVGSLEQQLSTLSAAGINFTDVRHHISVMTMVVNSNYVKENITYASFSDDGSTDKEKSCDVKPTFQVKSSNETVVSSISLPPEITKLNKNQTARDEMRIYFAGYRGSSLFVTRTFNESNGTVMSNRVVSANVIGVDVVELLQPIRVLFRISENMSVKDGKCVHWDFSLDNGIGDWSTNGCVFAGITEAACAVCLCDHLTYFAILLDYHEPKLASTLQEAMNIVSLAGCIVSSVCLMATIVTFVFFGHLRKRPQKILLNLSASLLFLYLIFATGINRTDLTTGCTAIAAFIHYFALASMFWMSIEAINMYLVLVKVYYDEIRHFMLKSCSVCYGVPLIIVVICLSADMSQYRHGNYCFVHSGNIRNFGMIFVVAILQLFNVVSYILILRTITCRRMVTRPSDQQNDAKKTKKQLFGAFALSVLLGLTWIFGLLAVDSNTTARDILQILFCIFNSFQGLFIFVLFCLCQKDVRQAWKWCCMGGDRARRAVNVTSDKSDEETKNKRNATTKL